MRFGITFIKGDVTPSLVGDHIEYGVQKHTYRDWGLIPASRPVVPLPEVKEQRIEVDAIDGDGIDLTESMTGYPLYKDREGTFEFYCQKPNVWNGGFAKIYNWLHGQKIKMILDDDPMYYYEGRCSISELKSDKYYSKISISIKAAPFKQYVYQNSTPETDILFDLIDFEQEYFDVRTIIWRKPGGSTVASTPAFIIPARTQPSALMFYVQSLSNTSGAKIRVRARNADGTGKSTTMTIVPKPFLNNLYSIRIPPNQETRISAAYLGSTDVNVLFNMEFQVIYRKGEL